MLRYAIATLVLAAAAPAMAQTAAAPQPDIAFADMAQAKALIAKAKAELKPGQTMAPPQPLVRGGGYRALVEYRVGSTPASVHDEDSELFVVLEGSGTLILGGTLDGAEHTNPENQRGTGISGGVAHELAPGAFAFAPAGMPHYFSKIGPNGLSVVTLHVPAK